MVKLPVRLAAYKKVNPSGKVAFRPLFLERVVALTMVAQYCVCLLLLVARDVFGPGVVTFVASFAIWILPNSMCVYGLRMSFREKYQLLLQLESFDLDQVGCSQKFDRDTVARVYRAICQILIPQGKAHES